MFTKDNESLQQNGKTRKRKMSGTIIKAGGRIIGKVIEGEFRKTIRSNWILRTPPAIANDIQSLHDAERAGAVCCVFTDKDTGITYRASISKIWDMGFPVNRGYGEQIALSLPLWMQERGANHSPTHTDAPEYSEADTSDVKPLHYESKATVGVVLNGVKQLSLFEGGE